MEPLTWVYLALLAASTAASAKSQQKTNQARARVQSEDTDRRKKQQQEAEAAALKTQETYLGQRGKAADREAELAAQFAAKEPAAPTTDSTGTRFLDIAAPSQSTRTIEAAKSEGTKGRARASQRATSIAQLGAFGETMREGGLDAARNAQDIGISASNLRGWTNNVLPALYAKANTAGKDWGTAADVMKLVAAVMAPAALGGGGAAAGSSAGTSANSTAGVLQQMGGTPAEFVGAFPQMTGTGFSGAAGAGLGLGGGIDAELRAVDFASPFASGYESDILKYLNDPKLWGTQRPEYWNYYK